MPLRLGICIQCLQSLTRFVSLQIAWFTRYSQNTLAYISCSQALENIIAMHQTVYKVIHIHRTKSESDSLQALDISCVVCWAVGYVILDTFNTRLRTVAYLLKLFLRTVEIDCMYHRYTVCVSAQPSICWALGFWKKISRRYIACCWKSLAHYKAWCCMDHQTQVTAEDTSLDIAFVQARMYTSKPLGVSTVQCCVPFLERVWMFWYVS